MSEARWLSWGSCGSSASNDDVDVDSVAVTFVPSAVFLGDVGLLMAAEIFGVLFSLEFSNFPLSYCLLYLDCWLLNQFWQPACCLHSAINDWCRSARNIRGFERNLFKFIAASMHIILIKGNLLSGVWLDNAPLSTKHSLHFRCKEVSLVKTCRL